MVAIAGTGWVLAPSLVAYVKEADRYYPQRDRSADGSIGDLAHQARVSDHNPSDGYVHAVDLDEDLAPGLDLKGFADKLLRRRDPRIKYVIYEGRIFKSYRDSAGHAPWSWMPYTGVNAHLHHLHLSILSTDAARTNTGQWGFAPLVEPKPTAPPEDDDMRRIVKGDGKGVTAAVAARWYITDGITARHVNDRAEAAVLVYSKLATWDDGEAFVLPQAVVDDLHKI